MSKYQTGKLYTRTENQSDNHRKILEYIEKLSTKDN